MATQRAAFHNPGVRSSAKLRPTEVCPRCDGMGWLYIQASGADRSVRRCECRLPSPVEVVSLPDFKSAAAGER